jgi:hypothetical protein
MCRAHLRRMHPGGHTSARNSACTRTPPTSSRTRHQRVQLIHRRPATMAHSRHACAHATAHAASSPHLLVHHTLPNPHRLIAGVRALRAQPHTCVTDCRLHLHCIRHQHNPYLRRNERAPRKIGAPKLGVQEPQVRQCGRSACAQHPRETKACQSPNLAPRGGPRPPPTLSFTARNSACCASSGRSSTAPRHNQGRGSVGASRAAPRNARAATYTTHKQSSLDFGTHGHSAGGGAHTYRCK